MLGKWEFMFTHYPHAKPCVELWRKGGRLGFYQAATIWEALALALDATGVA